MKPNSTISRIDYWNEQTTSREHYNTRISLKYVLSVASTQRSEAIEIVRIIYDKIPQEK